MESQDAARDTVIGLNRREWILTLKLVAIPVLALLYLLTVNATELPAELFIYGRF